MEHINIRQGGRERQEIALPYSELVMAALDYSYDDEEKEKDGSYR